MMGNAEARRQADIVAWIRANVPNVVVYAVPNDGLYTRSEVAKRKSTGVLAGVPDLAIVHPGGAAFLEIKDLGAKATTEQIEMMDMLETLGARCAVVCTLEEAQQALLTWGVIESVPNSATAVEPQTESADL